MKNEKGFTIIASLIVLCVILIIAAIVIPSFLISINAPYTIYDGTEYVQSKEGKVVQFDNLLSLRLWISNDIQREFAMRERNKEWQPGAYEVHNNDNKLVYNFSIYDIREVSELKKH